MWLKSFLGCCERESLPVEGAISHLEGQMAILEVSCVGGLCQLSAVTCGESVVEPVLVEEGLAEEANRWGIDICIDDK